MTSRLPSSWTNIRRDWPVLTAYQRFETVIAFLLTVVIAAVIFISIYRLVISVFGSLVLRTLNPLDHSVFQVVFGDIMTVLIALEFNHTLQYVFTRELGIIQARTVILIAYPDRAAGPGQKGDYYRPVRHAAPDADCARRACVIARADVPAGSRRAL